MKTKSTLKFRSEIRKSRPPLFAVYRLTHDTDGKLVEKNLGSFGVSRNYDRILPQLTPEERYEFDNFVKALDFAKDEFDYQKRARI